MGIESPGFKSTVRRLLAELRPEDCEDLEEYHFALEFEALPLGIDLWSRAYLSADGEIFWDDPDPPEFVHIKIEKDNVWPIKVAAERFPEMLVFAQ